LFREPFGISTMQKTSSATAGDYPPYRMRNCGSARLDRPSLADRAGAASLKLIAEPDVALRRPGSMPAPEHGEHPGGGRSGDGEHAM
jgi:hypothetical protein